MIRMMAPTRGIKPRNIHHPDLSMSCRRRTLSPSEGSKVASDQMYPSQVMLSTPPITAKAALTMKVKRQNHQYSLREARPLKSQYLLKAMLTAWPKLT